MNKPEPMNVTTFGKNAYVIGNRGGSFLRHSFGSKRSQDKLVT